MKRAEAFPHAASSVTRARRFVTNTLVGADPEVRDAVELMVSEVASNCVRHTSSSFSVAIETSEQGIRVEVTDQGNGMPELRTPQPTEPNGRGLQVVGLLSDSWGVEPLPQGAGKTVWFEIDDPSLGSTTMTSTALIEREADLSQFGRDPTLRSFPEAILLVDLRHRVLTASLEAGRVFGIGPEQLEGRELSSLLPGQEVEQHLREVFADQSEESTPPQGANLHPVRARAVRPDGGETDVEVRIGSVNVADTGHETAIVSLRETATTGSSGEPDQVWRYYEVAVRLAARLGQVSTENEALESILPLLLARSSWDVGCLWLVALDQRRLVCWSTWPGDGGPTQVFQEASRMIRPRVGEGLPGSAWGSGRPLMTNVAIGETRLLRQQAIRAAGLNTGVAFPLVSESGVLGVIEMFARKSDGMSLRVLEALAHIGQQIGNLLEHLREERRLREEARLRTFLLEAATAIAESTDYREALSTLAAIAVPEMGDLCLIDVKEPDGELMRMAAVHWDDTKADLVAELGAVYSPVRGSTHPANEVIDSGVSSWSAFMGDEYLRRTSRDERHFEILKLLGFESYMCIPLMDGDEVLGAITLVSAGSGRRFTAADLALPEELAARASTVIGAARRHQREHDLAHQLQKLLLPEVLPEVPGCGICVRYSAGAPQADTGGDFYDVVQLSPRRTALLIGDVEGHDTVAAAVMGQLRSASRALAGQVDGPAELVDALRASWETLGFRRMATALFAWLDPVTGDVAISSAGHLPPAYLHGGEATFVSVHAGPPFGVRTGSSPEIQMRLEPGDALVLYTDGLVEQRGVELEARMGVLLEAVRGRSRHTTLDDFCEHLISALVPEVHRLHDDIALLTVERS